ncbi:unnamed protein product [Urochloa humidicola]
MLVGWLPALLLLWTNVGRSGCDGSGGGTREVEAFSFRVDPWRIKGDFVRFGALVSDEIPYGSSLGFVDSGTDVGSFGGIIVRYVYQLGKPDWASAPTFSGGLLPLRGLLSAGVQERMVFGAPDFLFSGEVMAPRYLARLGRSTGKKHGGVASMLLMVPLKISEDSSSGGRSASTHQFRPLAMKITGRCLQGSECNFISFQGCLCKWDVNHQKYL